MKTERQKTEHSEADCRGMAHSIVDHSETRNLQSTPPKANCPEIDRLDIEKFLEGPEERRQEIILKYFEISGGGDSDLGIEHIPKIVEAGFVAICLKGECELMLDYIVHEFKAGRMCVGVTTTIVQTLWKSDDFECVLLATNLEFIQYINMPSISDLFITIRSNPCISLSEEEIKALPAYFKYIKLIYERKEHMYRMEIIKQLIQVLCYEVASIYQRDRLLEKRVFSYKESIFRKFVELLSLEYKKERRVTYYAAALYLTPKNLSYIIKEVSGQTAAEWIDYYIMHNVKILLTTTTLTVQQISDRLNFPNSSFFTQYFKRATGSTPKAYRSAGKKR
ncbi:MAG: helix-turn-helix domain-containing protein [Tannerella sp.]|nr:helix-turn-helix domain-containing protein [Tannerella sp.]